jgi:lipopolysaccharide biosynthesis glycosyltransferase
MKIFLCSDQNNIVGLAATVRSALEASSVEIDVHVLHHGINEQEQAKLRLSWPTARSVSFVQLDCGRVSAFRPTMYLKSRMAYARIYIGEVVKADRAIYLDTDLLVYGDLAELGAADLEGKTAGAIRDISTRIASAPQQAKEAAARLGLKDGSRYFNSGVMVLDLKRWRTRALQERCARLGVVMAAALHSQDQDLLNVVLEDDWTELELKWNRSQYETRAREGIVHLIGKVKPWQADYNYHWGPAFFDVVDRTAYRGFRPRKGVFHAKIASLIRKIPTLAVVASKLKRALS